jgi:hypothetical protein
MRNQYQAIGRLIMNLRNGRFLEDEDGIIQEAAEEFNDITLQLGYYWVEKLEGWDNLPSPRSLPRRRIWARSSQRQ